MLMTFAKNYGSWFRCFKDVDSQTQFLTFVGILF